MATNLFAADDQFYTDAERTLAADISRAFDTSRQSRERAMSYYNLPAGADMENQFAIARAASTADGVNRLRIARMRAAQPQASQDRSRAQGIAQLATLLLGRDAFNQLMRDGFIKYVRDATTGATRAEPDYNRWAQQSVFRTAEGNLAVRGQGGAVTIVNPTTMEVVDTNWTRPDNTEDPSGNPLNPGENPSYTTPATTDDWNTGGDTSGGDNWWGSDGYDWSQ